MSLFRGILPRGWIAVAAIGIGNFVMVVAGWSSTSAFALIFLASLGFALALLNQMNHTLVDSTIALTTEVIEDSKKESELAQEVMEDYLQTIKDLSFYDEGRTAVHYSRLRKALVKRHPELESKVDKMNPGPDLLRQYL